MSNKNEFWRLQKAANLSNAQAAKYLGVGLRTIVRWRVEGCNKPSVIRDLKALANEKTTRRS